MSLNLATNNPMLVRSYFSLAKSKKACTNSKLYKKITYSPNTFFQNVLPIGTII